MGHEYILTSDDEAFALAEQGRRLLLALAEEAFHNASGSGLTAALYAEKDGYWRGDDREEAFDNVNVESGLGQRLLGRAVGVPYVVGNSGHPVRGYMYELSENAGVRAFRQLGTPGDARWAVRVDALRAVHARSENGELRADIEALYEATDPMLAPEYAESLLPERCRRA